MSSHGFARRLPSESGDAPPVTIREDVMPALRHGPYLEDQILGRGGMAVVHVGRRTGARATTEQFAVKRILPEFARSSSFVRLFCREALLGSQLDHPNVVRVVDFGEQDGELLLVTEYVDGTSCGRMLAASAKRQERIPVPVALYVTCEILRALEYTHALAHGDGARLGIVHRDVSPGNILLGAMGEVKLADFGVARSMDGKRDTAPGTLVGKIGYMSPEQVDGLPIDHRTDIYSLGVVLFEMLTGTPFFTGRDDFELLAHMHESALTPLNDFRTSGIPFELRMILATALARDPDERFGDAGEFAQALRNCARHLCMDVSRRAVLVNWLRRLDVWPLRSGTYPAPKTLRNGSDRQ